MKTAIWIRLEVEHGEDEAPAAICEVVDGALEAGAVQDAINEFAEDTERNRLEFTSSVADVNLGRIVDWFSREVGE